VNTQNKIDTIYEQLSRIDVRFINHDFAELIIDTSKNAVFYLALPYYVEGNALYQHGFSKDDHLRLAELLKTTEHLWVLSYDDCPDVRALYHWAQIMSVSVNYSITGARRDHELLICPRQ
jgi:DNA adenine methylase